MSPRTPFDPDIEIAEEDETSITRMARMAWNQGATNKRLDSIDVKLEKIDARFEVFSNNFVTQKEFNALKEEVHSGKFVTKEQFSLIQKIVFTAVGFILLAFLGGLVALVYQGGS